MKINKLSTMGKVGILAAIAVMVSVLLPWVVVNVDLLSISESYTGLQIYDFDDFDYSLFPIIVMILGVLSVLYFLLDTKASVSVSAIIGIALGLGVVALSYLTYDELSKFAFSFGSVDIVTVSMGYGLLVALIGGALIIVTAVMNK